MESQMRLMGTAAGENHYDIISAMRLVASQEARQPWNETLAGSPVLPGYWTLRRVSKTRLAMIHAKTLGKGLVLPYEQNSRGRGVDTAQEVK